MPYKISRVDSNQKPVVEELRNVYGVSVELTHIIGKGFPDFVVGVAGWSFQIELKTDYLQPLTPDEIEWHAQWNGHVAISITAKNIIRHIITKLSLVNEDLAISEVDRLNKILGEQ